MSKRTVFVLLAGLNLFLAAWLILMSWKPPEARAQAVPLAANYLMVAAEIRDGSDALYILDLSQRRMHVFVPNTDSNNRRILHRAYRDLVDDFRGGR